MATAQPVAVAAVVESWRPRPPVNDWPVTVTVAVAVAVVVAVAAAVSNWSCIPTVPWGHSPNG